MEFKLAVVWHVAINVRLVKAPILLVQAALKDLTLPLMEIVRLVAKAA